MTHLSEDPYPYWLVAQRRPQMAAILASLQQGQDEELPATGSLLLKAVVVPASKSAEGTLIQAVALPWFEIIEMIEKDPDVVHRIHWRQWEEIIAGAYRRQGAKVVLTPRSGDGGNDVSATFDAFGSIRIFDQVKAYGPGHLVSADEVRSMVGVLSLNPDVSKGIVTTTSAFAPGVWKDPALAGLMPSRLELKDRNALITWLTDVAKGPR
jgi:restriction system protein